MNRRLKTASHLERMVLHELRRYALCDAITGVTVRPTPDGNSWELPGLYGPGGSVPRACNDICLDVVEELRRQYDLLPDSQLVPDDDLRLM
jgi:hypothetical protein